MTADDLTGCRCFVVWRPPGDVTVGRAVVFVTNCSGSYSVGSRIALVISHPPRWVVGRSPVLYDGYLPKENFSQPASPELVDQLSAESDVVVIGIGIEALVASVACMSLNPRTPAVS